MLVAVLKSARTARYYHAIDALGVGERGWLYCTLFDVKSEDREKKFHTLVFEGLDTICDVYLVSTHMHVLRVLFQSIELDTLDVIEWSTDPGCRQHVPHLRGTHWRTSRLLRQSC